jgi:hypothetical protein
MFRGKRYRIPANEFAIPRMEPGKQRPIQSMEEARDWELKFIREIKAGRDPGRPRSRTTEAGAELRNVSVLLDAYMEPCVKPAGLRSIAAVRSRVGVLKELIGELWLTESEDPDVINQFKTDSEYAEDVEVATVPPRPRNAAGRDELGHGADTAAVQPFAVPPVWRSIEQEQRPTASPGIGKLIDLVSSTDCPRFVAGNFKVGCGGPQQVVPAALLGGSVKTKTLAFPTEVPGVRPALG